tara:strand:- start:218 stop:1078 length:861 start_codon:yes stop_codon:yes gene_type:complete
MGYKIKDLEKLSGIKSHTIRIWEKRYGLLTPLRTDTKIRDYTDKDLVDLLNICILYNNGCKISHIALMDEESIQNKVAEIMIGSPTNSSSENLLVGLVNLDEKLFSDTLNSLIDKEGLLVTFSDYLIPFLKRIGVMWLVGTVRPCQEHFISSIIRQKVIASYDKLPIPDMNQEPILLYLPENEWHELGLLFYNYALRFENKRTVYLGQSMPYDALIVCVNDLKPRAIVTSCLSIADKNYLIKYFSNLKKDVGNIPIYAGGSQITNHIKDLSPLITEIKEMSDINHI